MNDSIVWMVRADGTLIGMTYERDQEVVGWHRHIVGGVSDSDGTQAQVESVGVIPGTDRDEVWISVVRSVDGDTKVYIEQFQSRFLDIRKENSYFVDSGIIYDNILTSFL